MSGENARSYADRMVRDALQRTGGDRAAAQRLILKRCTRDMRLLGGLTAPYLKGIITHALDRVAQTADTGQTGAAARSRSKTPRTLSNEALDSVLGQMGKAIGTREEPAGLSALIERPQDKAPTGEGHRQSLQTLAKAFAQKRFEGR